MKNAEKEEVPSAFINRSPLVLAVSILSSFALLYVTYFLFKAVNPWGFIMIIPTGLVLFQSMWLLLNPFAYIFETKFAIKQSLFHIKERYFIDIKQVGLSPKGHLILVYNDDETELIHLFGIHNQKRLQFKEHIEDSMARIKKSKI